MSGENPPGTAVPNSGGAIQENLSDRFDAAGAPPPSGDIQENLGGKFEVANGPGSASETPEQAASDAKAVLEDSRGNGRDGAHAGAGVKNADELLDAGEPGLRFFENFVPLYHTIKHDYGDQSKVPKLAALKEKFNQQRGMNFEKFAACAEDLDNAEKQMQDSHGSMSGKLDGLWGSWTGSASESAQEFFSSKFNPTVEERVVGKVSDAAEMVRETVGSVAELVRKKAETTLDSHQNGDELGGRSRQDWATTIEVANGSNDDSTLRLACAVWGIDIDTETCGDELTEEVKSNIEEKCHEVVRNTFADTLEGECEQFVKLCDDTKKNIDEAFGQLNEELGAAEENPFENPGPEQDQQGGRGDPGSGDQPGQQGSGGGAGAGEAGAGGAAGGGADGGAGAGGAGPEAGGGAAGAGSGGGGGGGQTPSDAMQMPPGPSESGGPDGPGGADSPESPGSPGGPGTPGAPGEEKVTLGEGEDAVGVGKPGPDGKTQVELIGEDGEPKTYEVGFGEDGAAGKGGGPGEDGPTPVQAGEDGKAVIEEGGRTITLERKPEGGIEVGVDNGDGEPPLKQTVDFGGESGGPDPASARGGMPPGGGASFGSASGELPGMGGDSGGGDPAGAGAAGAGGGGGVPAGGAGGTSGMPSMPPGGQTSAGGTPGMAAMGEGGGQPAPAPAAAQGQGQGGQGGGMMGGGMMGGGANQQGGDQERSNDSPWKTSGQLFDDGIEASRVRFRSVIGEEREPEK